MLASCSAACASAWSCLVSGAGLWFLPWLNFMKSLVHFSSLSGLFSVAAPPSSVIKHFEFVVLWACWPKPGKPFSSWQIQPGYFQSTFVSLEVASVGVFFHKFPRSWVEEDQLAVSCIFQLSLLAISEAVSLSLLVVEDFVFMVTFQRWQQLCSHLLLSLRLLWIAPFPQTQLLGAGAWEKPLQVKTKKAFSAEAFCYPLLLGHTSSSVDFIFLTLPMCL